MSPNDFIPLSDHHQYSAEEARVRASDFRIEMEARRSVRHFSDRKIDPGVIEDCLRVAASAPSGANRQPWHFVVVSDQKTKTQIRIAAEKEEKEFYDRRAPEDWLEALRPLGTNDEKPFLEVASLLIVIFAQLHGVAADGSKFKNYYVNESVGIATGMLITAIHHAGLVSLTHTPAPMRFLNDILDRPPHERPYLILVTGYPAKNARVPNLLKKNLSEMVSFK